ncbi:NAD(P)-binding protein [Athelia psychrophila]|uniref:NAD(P)-binding protein n=1 Tax=Athelia psychrophila TaxID=1759441 RepID=A0A166BY57_9AGAM|nr:NAD(P)-binding protein [Fibularhizoctonia sp. CBS 109695]
MPTDKKLILVFGATGRQGIPVIDALLAPCDDSTPTPYAVRAFTRDPSSERAQQLSNRGIECVKGSVEDFPSVQAALEGVYGVFVNTDTFAIGEQREIYANMRIFEIAKQTKTLRHYVFSGLGYALKLGAYNPEYMVDHFNAKGRVSDWLQAQPSVVDDSALSWSVVNTCLYFEMLSHSMLLGPLNKRADGTYVFPSPVQDGHVALIALRDIGYFIRYTFDHRAETSAQTLDVAGELITWDDMVKTFTKVTGQPAIHKRQTFDDWWKNYTNVDSPVGDGSPTFKQIFTGFFKLWRDDIVVRDMEWIRSIHPKLQSVEDWMRENNYDGSVVESFRKAGQVDKRGVGVNVEQMIIALQSRLDSVRVEIDILVYLVIRKVGIPSSMLCSECQRAVPSDLNTSTPPAVSHLMTTNDPPNKHQSDTIDDELARSRANRRSIDGEIAEAQNHPLGLQAKRASLQNSVDELASVHIRRLPTELLVRVFMLTLPREPSLSHPGAAPLVLGQVCRLWRAVSRSTPLLWSTIHIEAIQTEECRVAVLEWLERSRLCPLTVHASQLADGGLEWDILAGIAVRIEHLEIQVDYDKLAQLFSVDGCHNLDALQSLRLEVTDCREEWEFDEITIDLGTRAPRLAHIHVDPQLGLQNLILPSIQITLCDLAVNDYTSFTLFLQEAVNLVDCTITVDSFNGDVSPRSPKWPITTFLDFLSRSGCTLSKLWIDSGPTEEDILRYLQEVPTVVDLAIGPGLSYRSPHKLMQGLTLGSHSGPDGKDLVPNLVNLMIHGEWCECQEMMQAIESRFSAVGDTTTGRRLKRVALSSDLGRLLKCVRDGLLYETFE